MYAHKTDYYFSRIPNSPAVHAPAHAVHVAAQGWNEGFSENQFMEKNVIKVSVDPNRLDTP